MNDIASVVLSWALGDGGYERKEKVEPFGLLVEFFFMHRLVRKLDFILRYERRVISLRNFSLEQL